MKKMMQILYIIMIRSMKICYNNFSFIYFIKINNIYIYNKYTYVKKSIYNTSYFTNE